MKKHSTDASLRPIRKLLDVQSLRGVTDQVLVRRFVESGDDAAFRVIAERHGPVVLGVCRRALGCAHDAEDAFQATFLVFARKAASIRKTGSLASWFHGVSLRVAAKLQRGRTRRLHREHFIAPSPARNPSEELTWAEVKTGLDDELRRLPEQYRNALILCYLEGRTRDEAARQLGLTLSALHGRLERARRLLGDRLTRRGVALSAALLAAAVDAGSVFTAVRTASVFAACHSTGANITPRVIALTNQVLKDMTMSKAKLLLASLVCSVLLATGAGITSAQPSKDAAKETPTASPRDEPSSLAQRFKTVDYSDESFIRRVSHDLRGSAPTTTEVHFFVHSKDAKKRETLIDLFIREREQKKQAAATTSKPGDIKAPKASRPEPAVKEPEKHVGPGEGLIGRTLIDGKDIGVVFQYEHGKVFQHEVLEKQIVEKLDVAMPARGIEVVLQGQLRLSEKTTVRVRQAGGSVSHGVHTLYVDGREIGSVGDDRQKSGVYELNLVEGNHTVKWVLTGGRFGNNLLRFEDPSTASLLPLAFTAADRTEFVTFPAKDVIRIQSDERGWPIPSGW